MVKACCRYLIEAKSTGGQSRQRQLHDQRSQEAPQGQARPPLQPLAAGPGLPHRDQGRPRQPGDPSRDQGLPEGQRHAPQRGLPAVHLPDAAPGQRRLPAAASTTASHVEVDISRQVMALIEGTRRSTPSTSPPDRRHPDRPGNFRFYLKQAGLQREAMYYSVYFIGGYATHGYSPTFRTTTPATAASATRSRSPGSSTTGSTSGIRCTPTRRLRSPRMAAVAADLDKARETLLAELREHALVIGEVTLSSGQTAQYYVDAKRALLRPAAFRAVGDCWPTRPRSGAPAPSGGMTMGADPLACAAIARGARFGSRRVLRAEGAQGARPPSLDRGSRAGAGHPLPGGGGRGHHRRLDRGGDRAHPRGGARDRRGRLGRRPAGGRRRGDRASAAGAPYRALVTIDELYPERPDR